MTVFSWVSRDCVITCILESAKSLRVIKTVFAVGKIVGGGGDGLHLLR